MALGWRAVTGAGALVLAWLVALTAGADSARAGTVPAGFTDSVAISGLTNPTAARFAPDGRVFVDGGTIHRVRFDATSPPPPAPKPTPVIVGLGDSYSSGEANPRYDAGTDIRADRCHRSFLSWQRLVGVSAADQFACSGARLRDLTAGQHAVAPDNVGQLERLRLRATSKRVDWVALTIGGNDLGFARILRDCLDPRTTCLPQSEQLQRRQLDALEPLLVTAYRSASIAAGGARVAVVGYPYLFPNVRSRYTSCGGVARVEKVRIRRAQDLVEATLKRAAAAAGATFVSTLDALRGRELCTARSWMFPIHVAAGGKADDQQQAHPTACGQAAIARKVVAALHLQRTVYGCGSSKQLHVVIVGDTRADGRSASLRAVVSSSVHRRLRNIDVALTTILNPTPRSVTNVRVYDPRHFSADVDQAGSAAIGADRVWYSPAGASIRKVASCNIRYGCRAPAQSVPTRLATVRLLGVRGAPRIRPRRFVREQTSGTDLEFLAVRWAHWGARKAIGSGRMARCRRAPCAGRHAAVSLAAAALILCPVAGQARTVGYYHSIRYRRRRDGLTGTSTIPQRDDLLGACRILTRR